MKCFQFSGPELKKVRERFKEAVVFYANPSTKSAEAFSNEKRSQLIGQVASGFRKQLQKGIRQDKPFQAFLGTNESRLKPRRKKRH